MVDVYLRRAANRAEPRLFSIIHVSAPERSRVPELAEGGWGGLTNDPLKNTSLCSFALFFVAPFVVRSERERGNTFL